MENYDKALDYIRRAIEIAKEINDGTSLKENLDIQEKIFDQKDLDNVFIFAKANPIVQINDDRQ